MVLPSYPVLILITLLAFSSYALHQTEELQTGQITADLETSARLLADTYLDPVTRGAADEIDRLVERLGREVPRRLTLVSASGKLFGDSDGTAASLDAASSDLVRQCENPSCLAVFTSCESPISVIEDSADSHMLLDVAARLQTLSPAARAGLLRLIQAGRAPAPAPPPSDAAEGFTCPPIRTT